jgi:hypothetical protein
MMVPVVWAEATLAMSLHPHDFLPGEFHELRDVL